MLFIHQMAAEKCDRLFKASREVHNTEDNQHQDTQQSDVATKGKL